MAKHWYLCIDCKTPGCPVRTPLRYIGTDIEWPNGPDIVTVVIPVGIECTHCHQTYPYDRPDIVPRLLDDPPPVGYTNAI